MEQTLKQLVIKNGLIAGLIQVIAYYLLYFMSRESMASFSIGILFLIFIVVYPIVIAVRYRKMNNGLLTFKEGFNVVFMISLLRGIIVMAFTLLLFFVIDPSLGTYIKEKLIQNTIEMMQSFNTPADAQEEAVRKMQMQDQFSLTEQIKGFIFSIFITAVFALIVALILRRNPPVFESPENPSANL